ncbi:hypothetical protein BpHYR1_017479, partial [Brachionus plicatilis]
ETIRKLNCNNINVQIEYPTFLEKRLIELKFIDMLKSVNEKTRKCYPEKLVQKYRKKIFNNRIIKENQ